MSDSADINGKAIRVGSLRAWIAVFLSGLTAGGVTATWIETRLTDVKSTLRHELDLVVMERNARVDGLNIRISELERSRRPDK